MKVIVGLICAVLAAPGLAKTPKPLLLGSGPHTWIQHGLIATVRSLDLAIQGPGFFVLQDGKGGLYLTRHGDFAADKHGRIVYRKNGYVLLSANMAPIDIAAGVESEGGSTGKSFRIAQDGTISFAYADGTVQTLREKIGVTLVAGEALKKRSGHLFAVSDPRALYVAAPGEEARGQIYQASLEELDAHAYFLLENQLEIPDSFSDQKYEMKAEGSFEHAASKLTTRRVRTLDASDQWWQLSADDRLILYGRLAVDKHDIAEVNLLALPADYSCPPAEATLKIKVGHAAELKNGNGACSWAWRIQINGRTKPDHSTIIVE